MSCRGVLFYTLAIGMLGCAQTSPPPSPADQSRAPAAPPAEAPAPPGAPAAPAPATSGHGRETPATPPSADQPPSARSARATPMGESPAKPPASESARGEAPRAVPEFREVTIPAGTTLSVKLETALASDKSGVEDTVRGTLTAPLVVNGVTAVPANAQLVGTVREVRRSGRVKGRAAVAFRFERLVVGDESHAIRTASIRREAAPDRSDDVKKGAIGGAAGAIIGGIAGGGKGAVIGGAIGGTGAVLATRGDEVEVPAGTSVRTTLQQPLTVRVPAR